VFIDLSEVVDYVDIMVVTTGETPVQNRAIADSIIHKLREYGIMIDSLQGYRHGGWVLLDYGLVVVHIMLPELRAFYQLEELWSEGKHVAV